MQRSNSSIDRLCSIDFARLAVWVDGEGTISCAGDGSRPYIAVVNKKKEAMDWLETTFGDLGIVYGPYKGGVSGKNYCYYWHVAKDSRKFILKAILPYLVIKHRQANIMLALFNN